MVIDDGDIKRAALIGLRHERQRMDELIARLEREVGTGAVKLGTDAAKAAPRKRRMSAAGRANIIAAVKKRWAAVRKAKTAAAKVNAPKPAGKNVTMPKPAGKKGTAKPKAAETKRRGARKPARPTAVAAPVPAGVVQESEAPVS